MPAFDIIKRSRPKKSFRVASIVGKFDLQTEEVIEKFQGNIDLTREWQIGIIFGNSGTGKSTIAQKLFRKDYIKDFSYSKKTILDDMPENKSVDEIVKTFNSVGFSSPPSWLKSYNVLSAGEKMRVDLARAILEKKELIVFDEFTSVIDRNVAKIASTAISKAIKRTKKQFIAISCHEDIVNWLEPDWVFNTNNMKFDYVRGRLRRPDIKLEIYEEKGYWCFFKKYHYLDSTLHWASREFVAFYDNQLVGFCGVMHFPHPYAKNIKRITRLVILPDYQGIGIGYKFLKEVAAFFKKDGWRVRITTTTPALLSSLKKSGWSLKHFGRNKNHKGFKQEKPFGSQNRITTSWEYKNKT